MRIWAIRPWLLGDQDINVRAVVEGLGTEINASCTLETPTIILPVDLPVLPLNSLKELALSKQTCFNCASRRLVVIAVLKKNKKITPRQPGWLYQGDSTEKRSKSKPRTNELALKGLLDDISKLENEFHDWRLFGSDAQDTRDVNTRVGLRPYVQQK